MDRRMNKKRNFFHVNINAAIITTQHDLRGFCHPLGFRMAYMESAKSLSATTGNFMSFAAGFGKGGKRERSTDKGYVGYFESSFEDYLAMCKRLAQDCHLAQKEAIQLIVQEIVKQSEQMKAEVAAGKREHSTYLKPLKKDNYWGKVVLSLAESFEVSLEQIQEQNVT